MNPLVTIICLCYNHERYVGEAIDSALGQSYSPIQLIVVDDCSTDGSVGTIRKSLAAHPDVEFISLKTNLGNCRAFNRGFENAKGDFIIDLAADDVLMAQRVAKGIEAFAKHDTTYGVHFCDAELIDARGASLGFHSSRFPHSTIPQGDVYTDVLSRYFINSPTMMIRREVFEKLDGYDESLAYEDFDFWVRSSRYFKYVYSPEVLIRRRVLPSSLGRRQYTIGSRQLTSTLRVCEKALGLNRSSAESDALKGRVRYEMRRALMNLAPGIAWQYGRLLRQIP